MQRVGHTESERLSYQLALDFIVRFLERLGCRESSEELGVALGSNLQVFADALSRTLGKNSYVFLRESDGEIVAEARSTDEDFGPPLKWSIQDCDPVEGKPIIFRQSCDPASGLMAVGFPFSDEISFSGELWVVLPRPTEEELTFLRHFESWKAIKLILRFVVEQSVVRLFLAITPGLFDDQNSKSFLSSVGLKGLESLRLVRCPPLMAPGFEDVLTTFVQAGLLVDFESRLGARRETGRRARYSPLESISSALDSLRQDRRHQLQINILLALHGDVPTESAAWTSREEEAADPSDLDREAQAWLAEWTGMLGSSRAGDPVDRQGEIEDSAWQARLKQMLEASGRFLAGWSLTKDKRKSLAIYGGEKTEWEPEHLGASFITPWLRLWFCYELLRLELMDSEFRLRKQSHSRRLRYRRSLIYVLRENVRFFLYWWRADYRFRPRLLARELRRLVVHHAERALGIDGSLDLMELLQRIERSGDAGARELASGHLQHVFEVYITGQFLGSLKVGSTSDEIDLWSFWTRRPDTPASLEKLALRRSFAIAALLHDFGGLLFPSWGREIGGVRSLVLAVEGELGLLATDLKAAGQRIGSTAMTALRQHEGLFSDREWVAIERWQEERIERLGEPEPAVTGAWYVRGLMRQAGLGADLQRHVVRAMILDRVTSLPIDLESDPVAGLLVVCDSLFVWERSPPRREELVIGRSFSSLQASGRSVAARYDSMHIPGLRFQLRGVEAAEQPESPITVFCAGIDAGSEPTSTKMNRDMEQILPWGLPPFHLRSGGSERNDTEACLDLWLKLSVALSRIGLGLDEPDRAPRAHTVPWIRVSTDPPAELQAARLDVVELIGETAQQSTAVLRRALEQWLARSEEERQVRGEERNSKHDSNSQEEQQVERFVFELNPRGIVFADQDPRPWFEELRQMSERVILQRLANQRR